ncbi:MAG: MFS transporter [Acidobacteriaceae bacterium]|nr:MFS transporter [Acidobacteriaceae bacterium]
MSTNTSEAIPSSTVSHSRAANYWIAGFLLLGVLLGLLGSLLITWQYHIEVEPQLIGVHFLALNAGYVLAAALAQRFIQRFGIQPIAVGSSALALVSLVALSFLAPPVAATWRILGVAMVGVSSGGLATSLLYALEQRFSAAPAATANRAGVFFGSGCLLSTLIVGLTYFTGFLRLPVLLLAAVPLAFLVLFARQQARVALAPMRTPENALRGTLDETLKDLRSIAAVLLSLLLFFQFGNEWALAGWLPLFLIHRLGSNPVSAVYTLAAYFLALMTGRLVVQKLLPRVSHRRLLLISMTTAMLGYLLLSITDSLAGAGIAVVVIGASYAPIYPLVAERLDDRFSYHPGFYNGTFSIAITGATCIPWLLGYVDAYLGMRYVMLLPALGSILVLILALLIMLEAHLMSGKPAEPSPTQ